MGALGRGLASLIPKRDADSAEEMLARIDQGPEAAEEAKLPPPSQAARKVGVVSEDEPVKAEPEPASEPMPSKPLVTPLPMEPLAPGIADEPLWNKHEDKVEQITIGDVLINPFQPRRNFDPIEMDELVQSISQHGILQPLVVRRLPDGRFELVAGERRLRAAKQLKWDRVPCVIRTDVKSDSSRLEYALIENIQRENLNPVEEALAYKRLNEEYGLTHEEIGKRVGRSRVGITNIVRVLQLPAEIQRGLAEGKISYGHAKAILMIPDEEKQVRFYHHLVDEGLTVRRAELRARRIQRTMKLADPLRNLKRGRDPIALQYGPKLEERYGYDVRIRHNTVRNRHEITFYGYSEAEVNELIARLLGTAPLPHEDEDLKQDE